MFVFILNCYSFIDTDTEHVPRKYMHAAFI